MAAPKIAYPNPALCLKPGSLYPEITIVRLFAEKLKKPFPDFRERLRIAETYFRQQVAAGSIVEHESRIGFPPGLSVYRLPTNLNLNLV
jgi:hypothetical protein